MERKELSNVVLRPGTSRSDAPGPRGDSEPKCPWVCRKPAVSFIGMAPGIELLQAFDASGVRVVIPQQHTTAPSSRRHNGLMPGSGTPTLIAAILDTSVTVLAAPVRATARSLGLVLALKNDYHVALVMGASSFEACDIAAELERASGKTLGPDFGLCCASPVEPGATAIGTALVSSDRRAFETARAVYECVGSPNYFKSFNLR